MYKAEILECLKLINRQTQRAVLWQITHSRDWSARDVYGQPTTVDRHHGLQVTEALSHVIGEKVLADF